MGAIAEAFVEYARPLIDGTDGSNEQVQKALTLSQFCYNLALLPEESREQMLSEIQGSLQMDDEEFQDFRRTVITPMLARYREMFQPMEDFFNSGLSVELASSGTSGRRSFGRILPETQPEKFAGTRTYAPCPCNSGKKYKFYCRNK